jgi:ABC-2 type transport system ATP-binding protein
MDHAPAIEVESLKKVYRDGFLGRRSLEALKDVSFRVERGEIFALLGPNGAGKTTFIKILLGIVRKSGGNAKLLGHAVGDRSSRQFVGYLPENLRMPRHLNANTALEYYGNLSNMPTRNIKARREELLELVGLSDRAGDCIKKYSKGMLQKLGLAQALLHEPQLLILDEPTDGLDPVARAQVRTVLSQLRQQGTTVFLNSHLLQEVELICDRVAILDQGNLRYVGPVKDIAGHRQGEAQQPFETKQKKKQRQSAGAEQPMGLELELELAGTEAAVREALGARQVDRWQPASAADRFHVALRIADQTAVDRCVDDLRGRGISIIGLSRRRVSLEDAFIEILAEPAE